MKNETNENWGVRSNGVQNTHDGHWLWIPRVAASSLCLIFGLSHVAVLATRSDALHFDNPVFPFLSNASVFVVAGLLQLAAAILCYHFRNTCTADISIGVLVTILLWYRTARYFLGAVGSCGCAGYFGHIFHWSAATESRYAELGLILLCLCLTPSVVRFAVTCYRRQSGTMFAPFAIIMILVAIEQQCMAAEALVLQGEVVDRFVYTQKIREESRFTCTLTTNGRWSIESTNKDNPHLWSKVYFDGGSLYFLQPSVAGISNNCIIPDPNVTMATVSKGPLIMMPNDQFCEMSSLWLTFCGALACQYYSITQGTAAWPVPFWAPRINLKSWGYRWYFLGYQDSARTVPFLSGINIVRDYSLDKASREDDFMRPDFVYPRSSFERDAAAGTWNVLMSYTNGALGVTMSVGSWGEVRGVSFPKTATVVRYGSGPKNSPIYQDVINVTNSAFAPSSRITPPTPIITTVVDDYRYGRKTKERQNIFCSYTLGLTNNIWKSANDPQLLAEVDSYMKNGPTLSSYRINYRHYVMYAIIILVLTTPVIFLWRNRNQKNK